MSSRASATIATTYFDAEEIRVHERTAGGIPEFLLLVRLARPARRGEKDPA
jgi:hypothetical protein